MKRWFLMMLGLLLLGCGGQTVDLKKQSVIEIPPPTGTTQPLNLVALNYLLIDTLTNGQGMQKIFWCDHEYYPVHQPEGYLERAQKRIADLQTSNPEGLRLIQEHVSLTQPVATFNETETLQLYKAIRENNSVHIQNPLNGWYPFTATIYNDDNQILLIEGKISEFGAIQIEKQDPNKSYGCPICLAQGTRIATPDGQRSVEDLAVGELVWSVAHDGTRVAVPIGRINRTLVPANHQVRRITLADGRSVSASLPHPTSDGRTFGELVVGDTLDGSTISAIEQFTYTAEATYDILPASDTGWYWANDVLLASTLK